MLELLSITKLLFYSVLLGSVIATRSGSTEGTVLPCSRSPTNMAAYCLPYGFPLLEWQPCAHLRAEPQVFLRRARAGRLAGGGGIGGGGRRTEGVAAPGRCPILLGASFPVRAELVARRAARLCRSLGARFVPLHSDPANMSGWMGYVDSLMADGCCQEAAVIGYRDSKYVWAATAGGLLINITPAEIDALIAIEREIMFTNGLTLGSKKCSVIRDSLYVDMDCTMDVRTKSQTGEPTHNITIARAGSVMVVLIGKEGVHGGVINKKAYEMATYLCKLGF